MKKINYQNLLVINADIVTNIVFSSLALFHVKNDLCATVVCTKNYIPISYGVLNIDEKLSINNIEENQ